MKAQSHKNPHTHRIKNRHKGDEPHFMLSCNYHWCKNEHPHVMGSVEFDIVASRMPEGLINVPRSGTNALARNRRRRRLRRRRRRRQQRLFWWWRTVTLLLIFITCVHVGTNACGAPIKTRHIRLRAYVLYDHSACKTCARTLAACRSFRCGNDGAIVHIRIW